MWYKHVQNHQKYTSVTSFRNIVKSIYIYYNVNINVNVNDQAHRSVPLQYLRLHCLSICINIRLFILTAILFTARNSNCLDNNIETEGKLWACVVVTWLINTDISLLMLGVREGRSFIEMSCGKCWTMT